MKIIWSLQARKDLLDIYQRVEVDNPGAARKLHEKIVSRIQDAGLRPQIGRAGRVPATRELVIAGTPFIVPYRLRGEVLQILRFYHASRLWPETKSAVDFIAPGCEQTSVSKENVFRKNHAVPQFQGGEVSFGKHCADTFLLDALSFFAIIKV